ncbi:MAG TPA: helix-turn-helix domain-containing protein [Polyangiaceae bacterium]|nr:helix-turn-helix domain-containing protein [Polyangiaceae bacterium]
MWSGWVTDAGAATARRRFLRVRRELRPYVQFGFALPDYRRRGPRAVRRLPTARATIYFAVDVRGPSLGFRQVTGVFCEGPHSKGFRVAHECAEMVAVKVRAGGLSALLGVAAKDLRDATVSLEDVWGRDALRLAERLAEATSAEERFEKLQAELVRRVSAGPRGESVALELCRSIESDESMCRARVRHVVERSGYCHRSVLERFDQSVGLTPKQHARVTRLRGAAARLAASPGRFAAVAAASGYYDQAHMIHEFQALVGLPPGKFVELRRTFSPMGSPASGRGAVPRREQALYQSLGLVSRWV